MKSIKRIICTLMLVAQFGCVLSCLEIAYADTYISPELVDVKTAVIKPEMPDFEPTLGTYNYTVSWEGIPAADLTATVDQVGDHIRLTASAKTYSGIDIIYKLRYKAEGLITTTDFRPVKSTFEQTENSRHKFTEIKFEPNGKVDAVRVDFKKDEIKTLSFDPENYMLDPFAASFLARSVNWEQGVTRQFDTFNGKSRYLISLTAVEKTKIEYNDEEREVWVISPTVVNLSVPEQTAKLRKAQIYVTADKARDIVKIVSSVYIGSIYTELDSIQPAQPQRMLARYAGTIKEEPVKAGAAASAKIN